MNIQHLGWFIVSYDDVISVNCPKSDDFVSRLGARRLHLLVYLLAAWFDFHKNLDEWSSAQNRLRKMLVQIRSEGHVQDFFPHFL